MTQSTGSRRALWRTLHSIVLLVSVSGPGFLLASARLSPEEVPAAGRHRSLVNVDDFGRYSISVQSAQGVAFRLVDRMGGPGPLVGVAGEQDGRLDVFLERGDYLVLTEGAPGADGVATLEIRPFAEQNGEDLPELPEERLVTTSLRDFERRSYWIRVGARQDVVLEAAGRNLADLRLWQDGNWLVDASPKVEVRQPEEGRPLKVLNLSTLLESGLYLVVAYGGTALPWAQDDASNPLYLRSGIPSLGRVGRNRLTMSPFGFDRYRVDARTNLFHLELSRATEAVLEAGSFTPETPFNLGGATARITKESAPPAAEVLTAARFVQVEASAGQPYVLEHFEYLPYYQFAASGTYWISSVQTGDPQDSFDATGLLVEEPVGALDFLHVRPLAARAIELDSATAYRRRGNLLDMVTLFLEVKTPGRYEVLLEGSDAEAAIEPFFFTRPPGFEPPRFRSGTSVWDLEAGFHVLTLRPRVKGIVTVTVRPQSALDAVLRYLGLGGDLLQAAPSPWVVFPRIDLQFHKRYRLVLGRLPGVKSGLDLRSLPVDLAQALAVYVRPGETLSLTVRASEAGLLDAVAETGEALPVSVNAGEARPQWRLSGGSCSVQIRNPGEEATWANLRFRPLRLLDETPLPIPDLGQLPAFPKLTADGTYFFDLERDESRTFRVEANRAGLYRLQTTGLLATVGNLRSRTRPSFSRASSNGVGRNFLIHQYLREGSYQLTVKTEGHSAGHLGVEAVLSEAIPGGELAVGIPARLSLPAEHAASYEFVIPEAGDYRLRTLALDRQFRCRLEDADGWPLRPPGGPAEVQDHFEAGRYRVLLLPEATPARAITVLEKLAKHEKLEGHGPHALRLAEPSELVWMETADGQGRRVPDVWTFQLPAPVSAEIRLTGEMEGTLARVSPLNENAASDTTFIPPGRTWRGRLEPGRYRLEVVCSRRNNRVRYTVSVQPKELVAGLSRSVSAPADVPIAVGEQSWIELSSLGTSDVKATLYGTDGTPVATNDDRPNDWNFLISRRLVPGSYRLRVDPVGSRSGRCVVFMDAPEEVLERPLAPPQVHAVQLGAAAAVVPLVVPKDGGFFLVHGKAGQSIELVLEGRTEAGWQRLGEARGTRPFLLARLGGDGGPEGGRFQIRLNPIDHRETDVDIGVQRVVPTRVTEAALAAGLALRGALSGAGPEIALVELDRPGLFAAAAHQDLLWTATTETAFVHSQGEPIAAPGRFLAVASGEAGEAVHVTLQRILLGPGRQFSLSPGVPVVVDLQPAIGPVVVRATSEEGQPGVSIVEAGSPRQPSGVDMAVGAGSALSVDLHGGDAQALVWSAGSGTEARQTRIERLAFAAATPRQIEPEADLEVPGGGAQAILLPPGRKRIHLAMGEGLVAALSDGERVESVHWADRRAVALLFETVASRLTLLQTGTDPGHASVTITSLNDDTPGFVLQSGRPFEERFLAAGLLELRVASGPPGRELRIVGSPEPATVVEHSGRILREEPYHLSPEGGRVLVAHDAGPLICWLEPAGGEGSGLWEEPAERPAEPVHAPALLPLAGRQAAFWIDLDGPAALHFETPTPVLLRLQVSDRPVEISIHAQGLSKTVYCPGGPVEIRLRSLANQELGSQLDIRTRAVQSLGEGLGPEVLLAPGVTRYFSFQLERETAVGVGVRATADVVEAELLSVSGKLLGKGAVVMSHLEPGTYLLALRNPASGAAVRARPAVVGLETPGTSPPEEVIRRYLETGDLDPAVPQTEPGSLGGPR